MLSEAGVSSETRAKSKVGVSKARVVSWTPEGWCKRSEQGKVVGASKVSEASGKRGRWVGVERMEVSKASGGKAVGQVRAIAESWVWGEHSFVRTTCLIVRS